MGGWKRTCCWVQPQGGHGRLHRGRKCSVKLLQLTLQVLLWTLRFTPQSNENHGETIMNLPPDIATAVPALALLATALTVLVAVAVRRVPDGYALSIQRLGRYRRTLGPGWHLTIPVLDRAGKRVTLVGHHVEVLGGTPGADADVYYQILEPSRTGQAIDEVDALVGREAMERLLALSADPGAADLATLGVRLKEELNRQLNRIGLLVIRCQLHVPTL